MRILQMPGPLCLGGTSKTAFLLSKGLKNLGHEVLILYNVKSDLTRLKQFQELLGISGCRGYSSQSEGEFLINHVKPDIIHCHCDGGPHWPQPGIHIDFSIPYVQTSVFGVPNPNAYVKKTLFVSHWLMKYVMGQNYEPRKGSRYDFLNNPVEMPKTSDNLRAEFGIPADALVLGRSGRPDNGIYLDVNVRAAEVLFSKYPNLLFFVLAPPPKMIEDLEKSKIPYRIMEPTVDDERISKYYNSLDVFAHARSDGETQGLCLSEAGIHSVPCLTILTASPFKAQAETVQHGITGYVANSLEDYTMYLDLLLDNSNLRVQMGQAGQRYIFDNYGLKTVTTKLVGIYEDLLEDS